MTLPRVLEFVIICVVSLFLGAIGWCFGLLFGEPKLFAGFAAGFYFAVNFREFLRDIQAAKLAQWYIDQEKLQKADV